MAKIRNKTVKRAARKLISLHYSRFSKSFKENKEAITKQKLARIQTKPLRNKIAGYVTRLMVRLDNGPVRGISLKTQEQEREKLDNYVPAKSVFERDSMNTTMETVKMLEAIGFGSMVSK